MTKIKTPPKNNSQDPDIMVVNFSRSSASLRDLVEIAQEFEPDVFSKALIDVTQEQAGYNTWSTESIDTLATIFCTDVKNGLTDEQVIINREKYGPNIIEKKQREPAWRLWIDQFKSFVMILLVGAALLSFAFKEWEDKTDWVDGTAILFIVVINATLATYMEKSAGDALEKLASLAAHECTVIRNSGQQYIINVVDIVPGDIVELRTGDCIPADVRLLEVFELRANEAILTGESVDVKKTLYAKELQTPFASNLCFASTNVSNGNGLGLVYATSTESQVGKIACQIAKASKNKSRLTPLQKSLNSLGRLIAIIAIIILILIVLVAALTNYRDPSHPTSNRIMAIVMIAVGFCVSAIPEGLPMVVTICLSLGCRDMVEKNANIRKLPAVETLGSCTVVCSDKTGTLTEGKMTCITMMCLSRNKLHEKSINNNTLNSRSVSLYPTTGFNPYGGVFMNEDLSEENKSLILRISENDSADFDSIATNLGNPSCSFLLSYFCRTIALAGYLNCVDTTTLYQDSETNKWITKGNMSEAAILVAAAKCKYSPISKLGNDVSIDYPVIKNLQIPFNSIRKLMVTFHKLKDQNIFGKINLLNNKKNFTHIGIMKGAPERVIPLCKRLIHDDNGTFLQVDWSYNITPLEVDQMLDQNILLSSSALRVLAICILPLTTVDIEELSLLEEANDRLNSILQKDLIPLGLFGSLDPPRPGVAKAISECKEAGVKVMMITGDQKPTAAAISRSIGLIEDKKPQNIFTLPSFSPNENNGNDDQCIDCRFLHLNSSPEAEFLSEELIDSLTKRTLVFCRAQPEDKLVIVNSLKRQEEIVAMTGDGVNDAPALKAADIGVAMGLSGTEVARSAADMILIDDNFCTIVSAIAEGRKIYNNIQKFVCFLLGTNIGEIVYLTVAILARMKMPVEALQILFLNLMSDGCPAVALSREPADKDIMKKPPRNAKSMIMTKDWWLYGNLPHTIFQAVCVIFCLIISTYISTGVILVKDLNNQCLLNSNGERYFCQSAEYVPSFVGLKGGAGFYMSIDYWDAKSSQYVQLLRTKKGLPGPNVTFLPSDFGLEGCNNNWCEPPTTVKRQNLWVDTRGARIAGTQTFITAVFSEMLRAYTVRSWEVFWKVFNRNPWLHMACSLSASATLSVTVIPGVRDVFGVCPIAWWQYLHAIMWALLTLILDEVIAKPIYRSVHKKKILKRNTKQDYPIAITGK